MLAVALRFFSSTYIFFFPIKITFLRRQGITPAVKSLRLTLGRQERAFIGGIYRSVALEEG